MPHKERWFQKSDWHMFWLAVVTTWILYSQLWQMRVDTRPWIQFKPDQIPMPQVGSPIIAPVHFINVGKTPAKGLIGYSFVEIVDIDKAPHVVKPYDEGDNGPWTFATSG